MIALPAASPSTSQNSPIAVPEYPGKLVPWVDHAPVARFKAKFGEVKTPL